MNEHLVALETRLSHERARFAADGNPIRKVWIVQIEKEIAEEKRLLGLNALSDMTDDELLDALSEG
jgi:hypothetical protein